MIFSFFINFFIVGILFLSQKFLGNSLGGIFYYANFILIFLIFALVSRSFESVFLLAGVFGVLEDVYSFHPFGLYISALIFSVVLTKILLEKVFTNRSLYSFLALAFSVVLFYEIYLKIFLYFYSFLVKDYIIFNWFDLSVLFDKIIVNSVLTIIFFYVFSYFSNKLKPVFLSNK